MDKLKMHTPNQADENFRKLVALFPNAVTETIDEATGEVVRAIDKDVLMQEISARVVEGREERYQFTWPDKKKAMLAANAPIAATLRPVRTDSVGRDGTPGGWNSGNLYIEGDNLDVLKLLQETYLGKIKLIYIDPPYNTGNDFIYDDDFAEDTGAYLARSGQFDDQGNRLEQNTDSNGRFHTDWLNMIYTRLRLAKNLLTEDGLIFISIDENEIENLKKVCSEVFGQSAFFGSFIWHRRQMADSRNQTRYSMDHEYVIAYGKEKASLKGVDIDFDKYQNPDNDPRGPWFSADLTGLADAAHRPNLHYDVVNPETGIVYPPNPTRGWCCSKDTFANLIAERKILWPSKPDGRPRRKKFLSEADKLKTSFSSMLDVGFTTEGTRELQTLFDGKVFDFPKPVSLIKCIIDQATTDQDIILDFFSGSATTAQATITQNAEDGQKRRFILVQLPEATERLNSEDGDDTYFELFFLPNGSVGSLLQRISDDRWITDGQYVESQVLSADELNEVRAWAAEQIEFINPGISSLIRELNINYVRDVGDAKYVYLHADPQDSHYDNGLNFFVLIKNDHTMTLLEYGMVGNG